MEKRIDAFIRSQWICILQVKLDQFLSHEAQTVDQSYFCVYGMAVDLISLEL